MITKSLIFSLLLFLVSGCNSEKPADNNDKANAPEGAIVLTKEQFKSSGMTFSGLNEINASEKIDATGKVEVKPGSYYMLSALMQGRIKQVFVTSGDWVKIGQPLIEMEDLSIIRLQQDYLDVLARLPVLKADFERQKELFSNDVASEKKLQEAKANYFSVKARVAGLKEQLRLLEIDAHEVKRGVIKPSAIIHSPIDGNVSMMKAKTGAYMEEGAEILEIVDPSGIFVSLNVFENDVSGIRDGLRVLVGPAGNSTIKDTVVVSKIARKVDEESRSITVLADFTKNVSGFIPGMYLDAQIVKGVGEMFVLPEEAVVDVENRNWVLVKREEKSDSYILVQKEVKILQLDDALVAVLNYPDFSKNDLFLCKGAFALIR